MEELDLFMQRVMLIEAPGSNLFGGGTPAMGGGIGPTTAASNAPADVVRRLQGDALAFMQLWQSPEPAAERLRQLAARIEGSLTMLKTLAVIRDADLLINQLHNLIQKQGEPDGIVIDH